MGVVLVGLVAPLALVLWSLLLFSTWQRGMTERMAVKRYGVSYLSAEEIEEEEDDDEGGGDEGGDTSGGGGEDDDDDVSVFFYVYRLMVLFDSVSM